MQVTQSIAFRFWDAIARFAWERYPRIEEYANNKAAKHYRCAEG